MFGRKILQYSFQIQNCICDLNVSGDGLIYPQRVVAQASQESYSSFFTYRLFLQAVGQLRDDTNLRSRCQIKLACMQVTCHHLATMGANNFDLEVGLMNPVRASKKLAKFISQILELGPAVTIASSHHRRHSKCSFSAANDVIFWNDNGRLSCGQVWAHVHASTGFPMTLIQGFELQVLDRKQGTSLWRVTDVYKVIGTELICDSAAWCVHAEGVILTIQPKDL